MPGRPSTICTAAPAADMGVAPTPCSDVRRLSLRMQTPTCAWHPYDRWACMHAADKALCTDGTAACNTPLRGLLPQHRARVAQHVEHRAEDHTLLLVDGTERQQQRRQPQRRSPLTRCTDSWDGVCMRRAPVCCVAGRSAWGPVPHRLPVCHAGLPAPPLRGLRSEGRTQAAPLPRPSLMQITAVLLVVPLPQSMRPAHLPARACRGRVLAARPCVRLRSPHTDAPDDWPVHEVLIRCVLAGPGVHQLVHACSTNRTTAQYSTVQYSECTLGSKQ